MFREALPCFARSFNVSRGPSMFLEVLQCFERSFHVSRGLSRFGEFLLFLRGSSVT